MSAKAWEKFATHYYDLVILDLMIPVNSGISLAQRIRAMSDVPIIMITALSEESDRIVVMNAGRIEQVDTPEEIYLPPASVFVADFVGRANFVPAKASEVAEDGKVQIEALGQQLNVHAAESAKEAVRSGDDLVVLVRPESMRISATDEKPATLTGSLGQVVTSIFYGETVEYEIETEFGSLVCVVSDPRAEELLEEGQYVRLGIEAEKAWLLPSGQLAS